MTIEELKKRCNDEFKAKKKGKWIASIVFMVLGFLYLAYIIIMLIIVLASGMKIVGFNPMPTIIALALLGTSGTLTQERDKVIKKYKTSGEYQTLPVDYPYSLLYPGETWPFGQTNMQPQNNPINSAPVNPAPAPAPVAPAPTPASASAPAPTPAPAPVAPAAPTPAPESIVITCEKCGQQMLIPSGSGTVKLTCPKCGSEIIHTYGN